MWISPQIEVGWDNPQGHLMSHMLSLVLPLSWWVRGTGSPASERFSAQLHWHPWQFRWTGLWAPCRGFVGHQERGCVLLSKEHVRTFTAESEFCANWTFCVVLDGVRVSEVPKCCSSARNTARAGGAEHLENPLAKRQALRNGSEKPLALGVKLLACRISVV